MRETEYDFFISYSNADINVVTKIVQMIENDYGARCWFQEKDSKAEFIDAIMEGIEKARVFILFISENSANSYYVLNEVNHAIECMGQIEDYRIVPVIIDKNNPEIASPVYKKIRFYLGRLNVLSAVKESSTDSLVTKIFEQADYIPRDKALHQSLYHSSVIEEERLRAQNEILCEFSQEFFCELVKPEFLILDVGCASGENIIAHLRDLKYSKLLGVDIDSEQVAKAVKFYGNDKNSFMTADISSEEFADVLEEYLEENGAIGFDLIHISAVLLHLQYPVKVLKTLKRYFKKNCYLFIQDEDDGANLVYPMSGFFKRAFDIWEDSEESGDRSCGRKIPSYLTAAGYKQICLAKCGVSSAGLSGERAIALWDIYFNYKLWLAVEENMFRNPIKVQNLLNEYSKEYDKIYEEYKEGKIFIQLGFLFFIAKK